MTSDHDHLQPLSTPTTSDNFQIRRAVAILQLVIEQYQSGIRFISTTPLSQTSGSLCANTSTPKPNRRSVVRNTLTSSSRMATSLFLASFAASTSQARLRRDGRDRAGQGDSKQSAALGVDAQVTVPPMRSVYRRTL